MLVLGSRAFAQASDPLPPLLPPVVPLGPLADDDIGLIARIHFATHTPLKSQGVRFLSEPYGVPGHRFVFLRDPDGVLYQLVETAPPHGDPAAKTHLIAMPHVAVNVRDLTESLSFYRGFGYTDMPPRE